MGAAHCAEGVLTVGTVHEQLLWAAIAWALLLACPCLRIPDRWLRYSAILPAAVLAAWPGDVSLALPQFMLGTGLALENGTRLMLSMAVTVWLVAALVQDLRPNVVSPYSPYQGRTFFLLTFAGQIGAVLSADIVGFFLFSVLMGYSFYGLFVSTADEAARRGGRIYLILLIIADQLLFEAMLVAATDTTDLRFFDVRQGVAGGDHAQTYVLCALIGFALKAGLWPTHWWLTLGYRSPPLSATVLLAGGPVAMALLGAVRWLPFGQVSDYASGIAFQAVGAAGAVYGAQRLIRFKAAESIPAWGVIVGTGVFAAFMGRVLMAPAEWERYGDFTQVYIASLGLLSMALTVAMGSQRGRVRQPAAESMPEIFSILKRCLVALLRRGEDRLTLSRSWLHVLRLETTAHLRRVIEPRRLDILAGGWDAALVLFVLLGLLLAWLSM
jgi:NADH:ubiquinone oxidoreductase subunit 4 (subunit M)